MAPAPLRRLLLAGLVLLSFAAHPLAAAEVVDERRVEAARAGGLRWLASNQISTGDAVGSWDGANPRYRVAVSALAGMAFLADGHLPGPEGHGLVVDRALRFVLAAQDGTGYVGQGDASGMYIHALATCFALSCLGMLDDPAREAELASWCQRAIQVIIDAQRVPKPVAARGGWRYSPHATESDLSVTSWQLLALHAARQCGFVIDAAVFDDGLAFIERGWAEPAEASATETAAGFTYRPGVSRAPEPGATGAAVFIRTLLRGDRDERSDRALRFLDRFPPAWGGPQYHGYFFFVSLYLAQGRFQVGGEAWTTFAAPMQALLLRHQAGDGSWPLPPDHAPHLDTATGPAYPTALAVLILALERQYLPLYQRRLRLY